MKPTKQALFDRANEISQMFENGNLSDSMEAVLDSGDPATACILACCIFEVMSDSDRVLMLKMLDERRRDAR